MNSTRTAGRRGSGGIGGVGVGVGVGGGRTSPGGRRILRKVPSTSSTILQALPTLDAVPEDELVQVVPDWAEAATTSATTRASARALVVYEREAEDVDVEGGLGGTEGGGGTEEEEVEDGDFRVNLAPSEEAEVYLTSSMFDTSAAKSKQGIAGTSASLPTTMNAAAAATATTTKSSSRSLRVARPDGGFSIINDPKLMARRKELLDSLDYFKKLSEPRMCPRCKTHVYPKEGHMFGNGVLYHQLCSQCDGGCGIHLIPATGTFHNNKIYCRMCLQKEEHVTGYGYGNNGPFVAGGVNSRMDSPADSAYSLRPRDRIYNSGSNSSSSSSSSNRPLEVAGRRRSGGRYGFRSSVL